MSGSRDDTTKNLQKVFSAENVVIIAATSDLALGAKRLQEKWQKNHPHGLAVMVSWDDFASGDKKKLPEIKEDTKVYLIAHHANGINEIETERGMLQCDELAKILANLISDKQVIINLLLCGAAIGVDTNNINMDRIFAADLHLLLKSITQKNIPVIARIQMTRTDGIKVTLPIDWSFNEASEVADALRPSDLTYFENHHQEGSKKLFLTSEDGRLIQLDAYAVKLMLQAKDKHDQIDYKKLADEPSLSPAKLLAVICASDYKDLANLQQCLKEDTEVSKKMRRLLIESLPLDAIKPYKLTGLELLVEPAFSPLLLELAKYAAKDGDNSFRLAIRKTFEILYDRNRSYIHLLSGLSSGTLAAICEDADKNNDDQLLEMICLGFSRVDGDTTALYELARNIGRDRFHQFIESALRNDYSGENLEQLINALTIRDQRGLTPMDLFNENRYNAANPDKLLDMIFKAMESRPDFQLERLANITPVTTSSGTDIKSFVQDHAVKILAQRKEQATPESPRPS